MKKIEINIPENTYAMSDEEITLIHAMAFYFSSGDSGMTKKAQKVCDKLEAQFRMHPAKGCMEIWE